MNTYENIAIKKNKTNENEEKSFCTIDDKKESFYFSFDRFYNKRQIVGLKRHNDGQKTLIS